jgi:hypothetical protein
LEEADPSDRVMLVALAFGEELQVVVVVVVLDMSGDRVTIPEPVKEGTA